VAGGAAPDQCLGPSPPWRAWPVTAGCEAHGKAQGSPPRPGATGEGKAGAGDREGILVDAS